MALSHGSDGSGTIRRVGGGLYGYGYQQHVQRVGIHLLPYLIGKQGVEVVGIVIDSVSERVGTCGQRREDSHCVGRQFFLAEESVHALFLDEQHIVSRLQPVVSADVRSRAFIDIEHIDLQVGEVDIGTLHRVFVNQALHDGLLNLQHGELHACIDACGCNHITIVRTIRQQVIDQRLFLAVLYSVQPTHLGVGIEALHVGYGGVLPSTVVGKMVVNRHAHIGDMQHGSASEGRRDIESFEEFVELFLRGIGLHGEEAFGEVVAHAATHHGLVGARATVVDAICLVSRDDKGLPRHEEGAVVHAAIVVYIDVGSIGQVILHHASVYLIHIDCHRSGTAAHPVAVVYI